MKLTVAVTGATGFAGGHVVQEMLRHGHTVRAVVRDPSSASVQFLKQMTGSGSLEVVQGCLDTPGNYDDAFAGCDVVIHVAAVVKDDYEKDPWVEVINPSVEGTRNVIASAKKAGVRRIVATSSCGTAFIPLSQGHPKDVPYTEECKPRWATPTYGTYPFAKQKAREVLETEWDGELIIILPSGIYGPQQNNRVTSSAQIVKMLLNRELGPFTLPLWFDWCDVRDVAAAHRCAAEVFKVPASTTGQTDKQAVFIVSRNNPVQVPEIGKRINALFPNAWKCPERGLPWGVLWLSSWFDRRISSHFLYDTCVCYPGFDGSRIERELGFAYRHTDIDETLRDTVESFVEHGIVSDKRRHQS